MTLHQDRKIWGWGLSTYCVPPPLLDVARAFLSARLGQELPPPRPVPTLDTLTMPPPLRPIPHELADLATTDRFERALHTYGKSFRDVVRALTGDFAGAPDWVAFPRSEADLVRILALADREHVAVIPFGGGSSVVGGITADAATRAHYSAVLSLDLGHLNQLLEVDRESRCVRVQAGTYGPALEQQLRPHRYTLRHYPQSFEFSTVGGWIATRAGGHFATLYTHIDDLLQSLRMVTPQGIVQTRRLPGNGAGPEPNRLLLGSEGALGVISEAWLRVQDLPRFRASCVVRFPSFAAGAAACQRLSQSGLYPANARLIERDEALFMGAGDGETHILVLGFESALESQKDKLHSALSLCTALGGQPGRPKVRDEDHADPAASDEAAEQWKQSFVRAPYLRDELCRLGLLCETFETCTTWANFPRLDAAVRAAAQAVLDAECGGGVLTCRFTHLYPDGPAPYYTVIGLPRPCQQLAAWDAVKAAVSQALIDCGATITHHHAVGKDHRRFYERQIGPLSLQMLRAAKRAVDPFGIMNPGTLLPALCSTKEKN